MPDTHRAETDIDIGKSDPEQTRPRPPFVCRVQTAYAIVELVPDRMFRDTIERPSHQVPEVLYFRRDHPTRAERAHPGTRARCVNLDPRRAGLLHPTPRLLAEYVWGYVAAIRRAPLSPADRRACYRHLVDWAASRARPGAGERVEDRVPVDPAQVTVSVDDLVAGRQRSKP